MSNSQKWILWHLIVVVLVGLSFSSPLGAKKPTDDLDSPGFSSVDLTLTTLDGVEFSSGVAWDIDDPDLDVDQRSVVGSIWTVDSDLRAAYWDVSPGAKPLESTLVLLPAGQVATGINQQGEIVGCGTVDDRTVGLYWEHFFENPLTLPPLAGHTTSEAYAINRNGVICGISSSESAYDAVAWRIHEIDGELVTFGPLRLGAIPSSGEPFDKTAAIDLNDNVDGVAEIVGTGFRLPDSGEDAVAWKVAANFDGSISVVDGPQLLEFGPYSSARGIDFQGNICGYSGDHAVVMNGNTIEQLPEPSNASGCFRAVDINDLGEVVGDGVVAIRKNLTAEHAVVWRLLEGSWTVTDLDDYFPRTLSGSSRAFAINNAGEVVGDVGTSPFLLAPK
jgi:uncharacterized membrane protein